MSAPGNRNFTRVMLVDDHAIVREGYRSLLQKQDHLRVVAEAGDGAEAYRVYKEARPDLVIMDVSMPGIGGVEAIRRIRQWDKSARILVFTMHQSAAYAVQAIKAGARGFVTKSSPPDALLRAIGDVMAGRIALSPDIDHELALNRLAGEPSAADALSPREFEILRMLLAEKSVDDIAETLHISVKTAANTRYPSAPSSASAPTSSWYAWRFASGSSPRISGASLEETPMANRTHHPTYRTRDMVAACGKNLAGSSNLTRINDRNFGERHMPAILGSGEHRYRVVENWAKLPDGWSLTDAASVAVDSKDRIYVFNRGDHPMVVLDREGNFIRSWGEGLFNRAHGLHIDADDHLYCTDDGDHTVRKCTHDGKVLLTIGIPNKPAPFMSGEPFHRCTHTALSPKGEIYVSDGYGNACVHKYSPDGKLLKTWGKPGTDPGQFNIVHNIAPTQTAGSMSPIARTTAYRCSTATANTRRSGTICTGPARCAAAAASRRISSSANSVPAWRSIARCPISARGSRSSTPRVTASPGSAARTARAGGRQIPRAARHRDGFEG